MHCQYTMPPTLCSTFVPFSDNGWIDAPTLSYSPIKCAAHTLPTMIVLTGLVVGIAVSPATPVDAYQYTAAVCASFALLFFMAQAAFSDNRLTTMCIHECRFKPHPRKEAILFFTNENLRPLLNALRGPNEKRTVLNKRTIHDESFISLCLWQHTTETLIENGANPIHRPLGYLSDLEKAAYSGDLESLQLYLKFYSVSSGQAFELIRGCHYPDALLFLCQKLEFDPNQVDASGKTVLEHWLVNAAIPLECIQILLNRGADAAAYKASLKSRINHFKEKARCGELDSCERVLAEATAERYETIYRAISCAAGSASDIEAHHGDVPLRTL